MATTTITTTAAHDARIAPAIGKSLGLSGNASQAQVKAWLIDQLVKEVLHQEAEEAARTARASVTPISPT
jgi:hypothetical protein